MPKKKSDKRVFNKAGKKALEKFRANRGVGGGPLPGAMVREARKGKYASAAKAAAKKGKQK